MILALRIALSICDRAQNQGLSLSVPSKERYSSRFHQFSIIKVGCALFNILRGHYNIVCRQRRIAPCLHCKGTLGALTLLSGRHQVDFERALCWLANGTSDGAPALPAGVAALTP